MKRRVIFWPQNVRSPSAEFFSLILRERLHERFEIITDAERGRISELSSDDILIIHGRDKDRASTIKESPSRKILLEPRRYFKHDFALYDKIVYGSVEAKLSLELDNRELLNKEKLIFPPFCPVAPSQRQHLKKSGNLIKLVYFGNKVHWEKFLPKFEVIVSLLILRGFEIDLMLISGARLLRPEKRNGLTVNLFPFSCKIMNDLGYQDVGLVPQLDDGDFCGNKTIAFRFQSWLEKMLERDVRVVKSKGSTNLGRHLNFSLVGIPCVSDPSVSACCFEPKFGRVATSAESWVESILQLRSSGFRPSLHYEFPVDKLVSFFDS